MTTDFAEHMKAREVLDQGRDTLQSKCNEQAIEIVRLKNALLGITGFFEIGDGNPEVVTQEVIDEIWEFPKTFPTFGGLLRRAKELIEPKTEAITK